MSKQRKRPPDEVKVIVNKKFDQMQKSMTEQQKKDWNRKPYQVGHGKEEVK